MNIKDEAKYYLKRLVKKSTLKKIRLRNDDICYKQYDDCKCIFVHIPKCAGISVAKSLLGKRVGHLTALDYQTVFGKQTFNQYFKFTFTRNPFTRLVSAYEFMQNGGYGKEDANIVSIVKNYSGFSDFVLNYLTPATAKNIRHFRPQHYFICDSNDKIMVDFIGRFENLTSDYNFIRTKIGRGEELKKMNVTRSKQSNFFGYYANDIVVKKTIEIYKKDFDLFEYSSAVQQIQ